MLQGPNRQGRFLRFISFFNILKIQQREDETQDTDFISSFGKLLSSCSVPGTVFGAEDTKVQGHILPALGDPKS